MIAEGIFLMSRLPGLKLTDELLARTDIMIEAMRMVYGEAQAIEETSSFAGNALEHMFRYGQ